MKAYNIDHQQFESLRGYEIEHQLTRELNNVLYGLSILADTHHHNNQVRQAIQSTAQISENAQQQNKNHNLSQAVSMRNCSHGLFHYAKGLASAAYDRCSQLAQAIRYFDIEVDKYVQSMGAAALSGLQTAAVGSVVTYLTPEFFTALHAGVLTAALPIAVVVGTTCTGLLINELGFLGYHYAQGDLDAFDAQLNRIQGFATTISTGMQDYIRNKPGHEHAADVTYLVSTCAFSHLFNGMAQQLQSLNKGYLIGIGREFDTAGNLVQMQIRRTSHAELSEMAKILNNPESSIFDIRYKNLFGLNIFDHFPKNQLAIAGGLGGSIIITSQELTAITAAFHKYLLTFPDRFKNDNR